MMRTVWAYRLPSGEVVDYWYTQSPDALVSRNNGGTVLGPFKADIPAHSDQVGMFTSHVWIYEAGKRPTLVDLL